MSEYRHVTYREDDRRFLIGQSMQDEGTYKWHDEGFWQCSSTWADYDLLTGADSGAALLLTGDTGGVVLKRRHDQPKWREVATGVGEVFYGMAFRDELTGFIVGSGGAILRTDDGGTSS